MSQRRNITCANPLSEVAAALPRIPISSSIVPIWSHRNAKWILIQHVWEGKRWRWTAVTVNGWNKNFICISLWGLVVHWTAAHGHALHSLGFLSLWFLILVGSCWIFPKKCAFIWCHTVIIRKFFVRPFFPHSFYIILRGAQIILFYFSFFSIRLFASVIRFFTANIDSTLHTLTHFYSNEGALETKQKNDSTVKWRCAEMYTSIRSSVDSPKKVYAPLWWSIWMKWFWNGNRMLNGFENERLRTNFANVEKYRTKWKIWKRAANLFKLLIPSILWFENCNIMLMRTKSVRWFGLNGSTIRSSDKNSVSGRFCLCSSR